MEPHPRSPPESSFASRVFAPAEQWYKEMRWTRQRPPVSKGKKLEIIASYAPDWILTILTAGLLQIINNVYGFRREFSLTDTNIQYTHADHERISVGLLAVLAFIIPLVLMAGISLGISRSVWDLHAGILGLVVAHAFTLTATTVLKVCVGRPRPDFIDRCQPRSDAQNATPYGLATEAVCTTDLTSHLIQDGFRSFPSGHSSTAFAGLTFLTLWLAGKLHVWQRSRGHAFSAWILFFPMIGATLIAVSRTMDYRHHATDVIAGAILGFLIAVSAYHNYYPPLWHVQCHKPWSPRTSVAYEQLQSAHEFGHNLECASPEQRGRHVDLERAEISHERPYDSHETAPTAYAQQPVAAEHKQYEQVPFASTESGETSSTR